MYVFDIFTELTEWSNIFLKVEKIKKEEREDLRFGITKNRYNHVELLNNSTIFPSSSPVCLFRQMINKS